jgi:hypothetical protein
MSLAFVAKLNELNRALIELTLRVEALEASRKPVEEQKPALLIPGIPGKENLTAELGGPRPKK